MKITISQEGSSPIEIEFGERSTEEFPITYNVDFDPYKFLLLISQICSELDKKAPIKFEKENFQITHISAISLKNVKSFKKDIYKDPVDFMRGGIADIELDYIDKNKSVPNHNTCVSILEKNIVDNIRQLLQKNSIRANILLDKDTDYPINLKSDYRGNNISLLVKLKNNEADIQKHEKEFNDFCEKAFKSFIGKKIKHKSTITGFEPYSDCYSNGVHVYCDNLDDVCDDYNLMYEFERKLNVAIKNCPLMKLYDIQFVEDGYYDDALDFNCYVKSK